MVKTGMKTDLIHDVCEAKQMISKTTINREQL